MGGDFPRYSEIPRISKRYKKTFFGLNLLQCHSSSHSRQRHLRQRGTESWVLGCRNGQKSGLNSGLAKRIISGLVILRRAAFCRKRRMPSIKIGCAPQGVLTWNSYYNTENGEQFSFLVVLKNKNERKEKSINESSEHFFRVHWRKGFVCSFRVQWVLYCLVCKISASHLCVFCLQIIRVWCSVWRERWRKSWTSTRWVSSCPYSQLLTHSLPPPHFARTASLSVWVRCAVRLNSHYTSESPTLTW